MAKKIFVGNLSYTANEEDLRELFEGMGEVLSVKLVRDAATGRSRGFGFVEMTSDEDAERAIASLNGKTVLERAISVSEARPQAPRPKTGGGAGQGKPFGRGRGSDRWR